MMKLLKYSIVFMILSTILSLESCTHKVLVTEDDGYQYYKVTKKDKIGVKDLEGNVIVPIKMKEIEYHSRNNKQKNKDRWFWCSCYDNDYNEVYNADNYDCIIGEELRCKIWLCSNDGHGIYEPTSTFFEVHQKDGGNGFYDFMGKEVIPLKYETVYPVNVKHHRVYGSESGRYTSKYMAKYVDPSDLIRCRDYRGYCSVFDASGKCIIPDKYKYESVYKVDIPTASPLLLCNKRKGKCDYRYSFSGELFLSGGIGVYIINEEKALYYLENDGKSYDIYGDIIASRNDLRYDDEEGFYWKDDDYEKHYINKKISENGHVVPVHNYSNSSSWGWSGYGNQDIWTGSGYNGEYEWMDLSGSNDGGYGTTNQSRQNRTCGLCGGSGREIRTDGTSFGNTKYCSECGKTVPDNHYHAPCRSCGGKGRW